MEKKELHIKNKSVAASKVEIIPDYVMSTHVLLENPELESIDLGDSNQFGANLTFTETIKKANSTILTLTSRIDELENSLALVNDKVVTNTLNIQTLTDYMENDKWQIGEFRQFSKKIDEVVIQYYVGRQMIITQFFPNETELTMLIAGNDEESNVTTPTIGKLMKHGHTFESVTGYLNPANNIGDGHSVSDNEIATYHTHGPEKLPLEAGEIDYGIAVDQKNKAAGYKLYFYYRVS